MSCDFNKLERAANLHIECERHTEALAIYFFMAGGDPSLDAGHLAERIATCYSRLGEPHAARYWYGRALEENPEVYAYCRDLICGLGDRTIDVD